MEALDENQNKKRCKNGLLFVETSNDSLDFDKFHWIFRFEITSKIGQKL